MKPPGFSLFLLLLLPVSWLGAREDRGNQTSPASEQPLAAPYRDDRILPGSIAPDGRYGLLYPKEEILDEIDREDHLLLVALKPFHVLTEISPDISLLRAHSSYLVSWAKDSSAVLVNVQAKWGPAKVLVLSIHNGRAGRVVDLAPVVEKLVRPAYKKAKAQRHGKTSVEPFNNEVDFIFERDYEHLGTPVSAQETWSAEEPGKVIITCFCTNNPKIPDAHTWAVRFDGVWSVVRGKFVRRKITLLPSLVDEDEAKRT